ncbi:DUF4160 domain-containing protein [uncultured Adlercreutzia sp.]|uniref:DUF4160 domain-containing protein n=2 Tax=uncultured Adlercreutzia sp. TaxID=875803 RepID=UPI00216CB053|nr:DUF4160 domain-containing protein [uncultured Adlercreutzia sp.]MCI8424777.1 DUF4160 domain-containing protein [Adlercreutzia sp.]
MPSLSMFFGIIIYMYADDHNPPHFHAIYQGYEAQFSLDGELLVGEMPRKQMRLIAAWVELHRDELLANWDLANSGQPLYKIEPLR